MARFRIEKELLDVQFASAMIEGHNDLYVALSCGEDCSLELGFDKLEKSLELVTLPAVSEPVNIRQRENHLYIIGGDTKVTVQNKKHSGQIEVLATKGKDLLYEKSFSRSEIIEGRKRLKS